MEQSRLLPMIVVFLVLEAVNTFLNIIPAVKQPSERARRQGFIRAGIVNVVMITCFVAYLALRK